MNLLIRSLAISLLSISFIVTADDSNPNPIVEKTMGLAISEVCKSIDHIADGLVKNLEKIKSEAMKKNDLDTAMAVAVKIKEVKAGKLMEMAAAERGRKTDLLGETTEQTIDKLIIGKWYVNGRRYEFFSNGKCLCMNSILGIWKLNNDKIDLSWSNGANESIARTGKQLFFNGTLMVSLDEK